MGSTWFTFIPNAYLFQISSYWLYKCAAGRSEQLDPLETEYELSEICVQYFWKNTSLLCEGKDISLAFGGKIHLLCFLLKIKTSPICEEQDIILLCEEKYIILLCEEKYFFCSVRKINLLCSERKNNSVRWGKDNFSAVWGKRHHLCSVRKNISSLLRKEKYIYFAPYEKLHLLCSVRKNSPSLYCEEKHIFAV